MTDAGASYDPTRLDGRVALVTGSGRGLGRAHALALAGLGATIVVNDLGTDLDGMGTDPGPAHDTVAEIEQRGGCAVAHTGDIASIGGGRAAVEVALERFGRIDIVVNNAGFAHGGGTVEAPVADEIHALFNVHLMAALGTMSAALPHMRAAGYGRIINTVSEAALDARFVASLGYGVAKAALWSATLVAAAEARGSATTVNAISPGARTRMNDTLLETGFRDGASAALDLSPVHVARVVAYLASPAAADITGHIIHAAAGQVREYTTRRIADTDTASRLRHAFDSEDSRG